MTYLECGGSSHSYLSCNSFIMNQKTLYNISFLELIVLLLAASFLAGASLSRKVDTIQADIPPEVFKKRSYQLHGIEVNSSVFLSHQSCQRTGRTPRRRCWRGWCSTWSTWAWHWWASPKERTWLQLPFTESSPRWVAPPLLTRITSLNLHSSRFCFPHISNTKFPRWHCEDFNYSRAFYRNSPVGFTNYSLKLQSTLSEWLKGKSLSHSWQYVFT